MEQEKAFQSFSPNSSAPQQVGARRTEQGFTFTDCPVVIYKVRRCLMKVPLLP